jgi:hypothetical protein
MLPLHRIPLRFKITLVSLLASVLALVTTAFVDSLAFEGEDRSRVL